MDNVEKAVEIYDEGFSCSQAVIAAYCEQFGLDSDTALKISSGFGGGMHLNQTCGAVIGAFMVIGLKYGRNKAEDADAKIKTYKLMADFTIKFKEYHKYIGCSDLLGCNLTKAEGLQKAKELNLFKTKCPDYVKSAAKILEEIL